MRVDRIELGSLEHVTRHGVSQDEVEQAFLNVMSLGRNRRGRSAQYVVLGKTDGGRVVRANFCYEPDTRTARVISAWEV